MLVRTVLARRLGFTTLRSQTAWVLSAARNSVPVSTSTLASAPYTARTIATTAVRHNDNLGGKATTHGTGIPKEILELPLQKYHEESDLFLEDLYDDLEELSQKYAKQIPELEYNQGVITLTVDGLGTYVINKQPPNKQIWLASPKSGPNRFDLYQGTWISLRDNANLLETLNEELHEALPKDAEFNIVR